MSGIFQHTSREPGMWRGWFENGHCIEVHWGREPIGLRLGDTDADDDQYRRQLWIGLGFVQAFIPLWRIEVDRPSWEWMDGPEWGLRADRDGGRWSWGKWSKHFDWPWSWHTLAYEKQLPVDGEWVDVLSEQKPGEQIHSYTYVLRSGEVQKRLATVSKRRHIITYNWLRWTRLFSWVKESIDVEFDGEVGERSGSWKGGTIGCGYELRKGETMLDALRRMEREREFR